MLAFIAYFTLTRARPSTWTAHDKPLAAEQWNDFPETVLSLPPSGRG